MTVNSCIFTTSYRTSPAVSSHILERWANPNIDWYLNNHMNTFGNSIWGIMIRFETLQFRFACSGGSKPAVSGTNPYPGPSLLSPLPSPSPHFPYWNIATPFGKEKLEWCGYSTVKIFPRYVYSFRRDPRTWQTDTQTPHNGIGRSYA